ncbi:MAG: threonine-phosphate decarboxylase [bacterium]
MANLEHGGNIYKIEREYNKKVIDFSSNINPFLKKGIKKEIIKNLDKISCYPDIEQDELVSAISNYWGIKRENILLGNGSSELIYLLNYALRPKSVFIPQPTFSEYEASARAIEAKIQYLPLGKDFTFNLSNQKADIAFVCNPNNPTGNLLIKNKELGYQGLIVIDEAFMDFLIDEEKHSFVWNSVSNKNIIVLRTLTKFFSIPGLRIGYLVGERDLIGLLKKHQPPWNINVFAQIVGEIILKNKDYVIGVRKFIEQERDFLFAQLRKIKGLKPFPSCTNFFLIKIESGITSKFLREELIKKGILIRDCSNFRNLSDKYIRVSIRSSKENLILIEKLKEAI